MKVGLIASLLADLTQRSLVPRFTAVAASLGQHPFILCVVMDKAHGLALVGAEVEQNCPAAFDMVKLP